MAIWTGYQGITREQEWLASRWATSSRNSSWFRPPTKIELKTIRKTDRPDSPPKMVRDFILNDVVWCPGQKNEFVPAKIVAEESSDEWQKDGSVFVQVYHGGPGRRPRGKWLEASDLVLFEAGKDDELKFVQPALNKAYKLAKEDFLKNERFAKVDVKRCEKEEMKTPAQTKRRGRPPKSASSVKGSSRKSSTKKAKIISRMLQDSESKNQLNMTDDDEEEEDLDEDTKAKMAADNKNFLDDLDDSDDDDDKENDREWSPSNDNKENARPKSKFSFSGSKKKKGGRMPFEPIAPFVDEISEYEKIQEKRKAEQRYGSNRLD